MMVMKLIMIFLLYVIYVNNDDTEFDDVEVDHGFNEEDI
jgi:hypothetical protein